MHGRLRCICTGTSARLGGLITFILLLYCAAGCCKALTAPATYQLWIHFIYNQVPRVGRSVWFHVWLITRNATSEAIVCDFCFTHIIYYHCHHLFSSQIRL